MTRILRCGYHFNVKKTAKFEQRGIVFESQATTSAADSASSSASASSDLTPVAIQYEYIDLSSPVSESLVGCYDLLLLKVTDHQAAAHHFNDEQAAAKLRHLQTFIDLHTRSSAASNPMCVVDPLSRVAPLLSRIQTHALLTRANLTLRDGVTKVRPPHSVSIEASSSDTLLHAQSLDYPVILKPDIACGLSESHEMIICHEHQQIKSICNAEGRHAAEQTSATALASLSQRQWIAQQYIPHGHAIAKVYVCGPDSITITHQGTLHIESIQWQRQQRNAPDQGAADPTPAPVMQRFNSQHIKKLSKDASSVTADAKLFTPDFETELRHIAMQLIDRLQLTLFGFDVIQSSDSQKLYICDVNYFPSYKNVEDFPQALTHALIDKYKAHLSAI